MTGCVSVLLSQSVPLGLPPAIKGPCFDCDVWSCWCGWGDNDECACHSPMGERTAPIIKIEPEELRPNVPPMQDAAAKCGEVVP
jgi:hypothetical protein